MINILVTGSNGQLGQCLKDLKDIHSNINFTFVSSSELDISDKKSIEIIFSAGEFKYCINCAAYTKVDKAEEEVELAYSVNAEAVKYLAESCKENDVTLIHISTDFVFDGQKAVPYTENDDPNPINVYGSSKLKGEQYVQEIMEDYFIIRTSWVYSEYGNNFVKTMLRLADEKKEINVVNDQIGNPTYAGDLARFILFLINEPSVNRGIYNFSNFGNISWYDFATKIFQISKNQIKINWVETNEYPTKARRPSYSVLELSKTNRIYPIWAYDYSLKKLIIKKLK